MRDIPAQATGPPPTLRTNMTHHPDWKQSLSSFLAPKPVSREIGGQAIDFYPVSGRLFFQLKGVARPLAQAVSTLFVDTKQDVGQSYRDLTVPPGFDEEGNPTPTEVSSETSRGAVSVEILQERTKQQEMAIDRLVDAYSDPEVQRLFVRAIFDSCRDHFPRRPTQAQIDEFLDDDSVTLEALKEFAMGLLAANARVFGPLAQQVSANLKTRVETAMGAPHPSEGESASEPTPTSSPTPPATSVPSPTPPIPSAMTPVPPIPGG